DQCGAPPLRPGDLHVPLAHPEPTAQAVLAGVHRVSGATTGERPELAGQGTQVAALLKLADIRHRRRDRGRPRDPVREPREGAENGPRPIRPPRPPTRT